MNNIYVDKLRKTCRGCFCKDCDSWCSLLKRYMDYKDERKRPKDCPLKLITDRLAEERKKVVQEIRELHKERQENWNNGCEVYHDMNVLPDFVIEEILDQIEGGVK